MLQSDELAMHHMGLKVIAPKVTNGTVIQEGIRRKRTKKPAPVGKVKKVKK